MPSFLLNYHTCVRRKEYEPWLAQKILPESKEFPFENWNSTISHPKKAIFPLTFQTRHLKRQQKQPPVFHVSWPNRSLQVFDDWIKLSVTLARSATCCNIYLLNFGILQFMVLAEEGIKCPFGILFFLFNSIQIQTQTWHCVFAVTAANHQNSVCEENTYLFWESLSTISHQKCCDW